MPHIASIRTALWALILSYSASGQIQSVGQWRSHVPYRLATHVVQANERVYVACESGLFIYHADEKYVEPLTKVEGLTDVDITAMAYDAETDQVIVGYRNGNIDCIREDKVINMPDMVRSPLYPGKKKIAHIHCGAKGTARAGRPLLSTDFGVVELDLIRYVVIGTYLVGPNAQEVRVNETFTSPDSIWVATQTGLVAASQQSALYNPSVWNRDAQWQNRAIQNVAFGGSAGAPFLALVIADEEGDTLWIRRKQQWKKAVDQSGIPSHIFQLLPQDSVLLAVRSFDVARVAPGASGSPWTLDLILSPGTGNNPGFRPRGVAFDPSRNIVWTANSSRGLTFLDNPSYVQHRVPQGPRTGNVFHLYTPGNKLYVSPGAMDATWTAQYNNDGFFIFQGGRWTAKQGTSVGNVRDIVHSIARPTDTAELYVSSWGKGLLKFKNGELETVYDTSNSTLSPALGSTAMDLRTGGVAFDTDGNLWVVTALASKNLHRMTPGGVWTGFSLGQFSGEALRDVFIDEGKRLWMPSRLKGILVANPQGNSLQLRRMSSGAGEGNLPSPDVRTLAFDLDGELWIGTSEGLAVSYTPYNAFVPGKNFDAQPILKEENGIVQKVLGSENITAIAVDGGNRKWVGTQSSGLFLLGPDGLDEIYRFTAENSPLFSNQITALAVDPFTGELFIGTDRGLQSFRAEATAGGVTFGDVVAFPNPVPPEYDGPISVRGLKANVQCKVTDASARMIYEGTAEGGQFVWPGTTLDGQRVGSGIYHVYCTDDLGMETFVATLVVTRNGP